MHNVTTEEVHLFSFLVQAVYQARLNSLGPCRTQLSFPQFLEHVAHVDILGEMLYLVGFNISFMSLLHDWDDLQVSL